MQKQTITRAMRRKVEAAFHRMDPSSLDALMAKAVRVDPTLPTSIRLPSALVGIVTVLARLEGKPYQTLMKEWIRDAALARAQILSLALHKGRGAEAAHLRTALETLTRETRPAAGMLRATGTPVRRTRHLVAAAK